MTENERLTEKRDGQNVIPLRQDGKTKWSLASAGMGESSTQFLYGAHADKLAGYESIGTIEEFKALKEKSEPKEPIIIDNRLNDIEWKCPVCGLNVIEEPPCQEYCQRCGNKLDWSE